jgi:hypothetical protein
LQATVQAWKPMHLRLSIKNPKVGMMTSVHSEE